MQLFCFESLNSWDANFLRTNDLHELHTGVYMSYTKICHRCGQRHTAKMFKPSKRTKDGLTSWCSRCIREYAKAYYKEHKEAMSAQRKRNRAILRISERAQLRARIKKEIT